MEQIEVGQAWATQAKDGLPPLLVVIGRLENLAGFQVAGVSVSPHPLGAHDGWPDASHLPIALGDLGLEEAMLVRTDAVIGPEFEEGYDIGKAAYDDGKAGFFKITARDAYAFAVGIAKQ